MDEYDGIPPATAIVEAKDVSKERFGLYTHAFTEQGRNERLVATLKVHIKPNTMARLKLFCDDNENAYPLIDEIVDEALHDYLCSKFW